MESETQTKEVRTELDRRINLLEESNTHIRFIFGVARWAAGALLMMLVFVVNQCSENASNIKTNIVRLDAVHESIAALDKRVEVNYHQTMANLGSIQADILKLENANVQLADLDKRLDLASAQTQARIQINDARNQLSLTTLQDHMNRLSLVSDKLMDLDKRATVNRETENKDISALKEWATQSDEDIRKELDILSLKYSAPMTRRGAPKP